jgi:hypothetical protein
MCFLLVVVEVDSLPRVVVVVVVLVVFHSELSISLLEHTQS